MHARSLLRLLPLLVLVLAGGCAPRAAEPEPDAARSASDPPDLLASVQATTYGDSVQFVMQVTNTTAQPVVLEFRSGQRFDFVVERDGAEVWRWSDGQMFTQALSSEPLPAGGTLSYSTPWAPGPAAGGEFTVRGVLTAEPPNRAAQRARFRIR